MKEHASLAVIPGIIETQHGLFNVRDPLFRLEDIAHSLGHLCRFTGHTKEFYSVADHSILVSIIAENTGGDPFEGLMHDAHEAYLGDFATPWKQELPEYAGLDARIYRPLRQAFHLPPQVSPEIKTADIVALYMEGRRLMPCRSSLWPEASAYVDAVIDALPMHLLHAIPLFREPRAYPYSSVNIWQKDIDQGELLKGGTRFLSRYFELEKRRARYA